MLDRQGLFRIWNLSEHQISSYAFQEKHQMLKNLILNRSSVGAYRRRLFPSANGRAWPYLQNRLSSLRQTKTYFKNGQIEQLEWWNYILSTIGGCWKADSPVVNVWEDDIWFCLCCICWFWISWIVDGSDRTRLWVRWWFVWISGWFILGGIFGGGISDRGGIWCKLEFATWLLNVVLEELARRERFSFRKSSIFWYLTLIVAASFSSFIRRLSVAGSWAYWSLISAICFWRILI